MDLLKSLSHVTIRGRVGFGLAVAERELWRVEEGHAGHPLACAALDAGWRWAAGHAVDSNVFNDALHDERDAGLLILEQQADGNLKLVWLLLASAIAYAGWHAYRLAGESMPEVINQTDEHVLAWLIEYAVELSPTNRQFIESAAERARSQFPTNDPDEVGRAIGPDDFR